jgi:hypothetical protein
MAGPRHSRLGFALALALGAVLAASAAAADPLTGDVPVSDLTDDNQSVPRVAIGQNGGFLAVYEHEVDLGGGARDNGNVRARWFNANGTPVAPSFEVPESSAQLQELPDVDTTPCGNAVVVWEQFAGNSDVHGRLVQGGVPVGDNLPLAEGLARQILPRVAMHPDGTFWVAYVVDNQNANGNDVVLQRFNAAGLPATGVLDVASGADHQTEPDVAVHPDGSATVAFTNEGGSDGGDVHARRFDAAGVPIGNTIPLDPTGAGLQNIPFVDADAGGLTAAWTDGNDVKARRFNSNAQNSAEVTVSDPQTASDDAAGIATEPDGDSVIVWNSSAGDGGLMRRFSAAMAPLSDIEPVNATQGDTAPNDVAASGDSYTVVWQREVSNQQDVFARRFSSPSGTPGPGCGSDPDPNQNTSPPITNNPLPPPPDQADTLDVLPPSGFAIATRALSLGKNNRIKFTVNGPANETAPSFGLATLVTAGRVNASARRRVTLGKAKFTVPPGARRTVTMKLSRKNAKLVRRLKSVRVKLSVTLTDSQGNKSRPATRRLVLKPKRSR